MSDKLPFAVTPYYKSLCHSDMPEKDPIAAQFIKQDHENTIHDYESTDPLGDADFTVSPRLIHHYHDRVLMLANDRCAVYCRHCFRRHFTAHSTGRITEAEVDKACEYIKNAPEVQEILISGGDPLMLPDEHIKMILDKIYGARPELVVRICTRIPVVMPARITDSLAQLLGSYPSVWLITQTNHSREVSKGFSECIDRLSKSGIQAMNQAVLLRGINDSVDELYTLFRRLLQARVKPYYLFQGDLASGTSHFRVNLKKGIQLYTEIRRKISGLALPFYAVDIPGAGKIHLNEHSIVKEDADFYYIKGYDGKTHSYPIENIDIENRDAIDSIATY